MSALLRPVQINTIAELRERIGSKRFVRWLCKRWRGCGYSPVQALNRGMWQEAAEMADTVIERSRRKNVAGKSTAKVAR